MGCFKVFCILGAAKSPEKFLAGQQILIFQLCLRPEMGQAGNDKVKDEGESFCFCFLLSSSLPRLLAPIQ